jgi:hypothetical protein
LVPRDTGVEAYDADNQSLSIHPDQKSSAATVSANAAIVYAGAKS